MVVARDVRRGLIGIVMLATLAGLVPRAEAQGVILPEIPFTSKYGTSARAAGLGYAYGAVAEDGNALWFNPAGLAQIRRIEVGAGLMHEQQTRENGFDTATDGFPGTGFATTSSEVNQTPLTHVTFAYPFPTYRGSLVMAAAYQQISPLRTDYFRKGNLVEQDGLTPGLRETESYFEQGSINFWTIGLAGDLGKTLSVGGTLSYIDGNSSQDFEVSRKRVLPDGTTDVNGSDEVFRSTELRDADISGWTFSLGVLGRPSEKWRVGVTVNGVEDYNFTGTSQTAFEDQEKVDTSGIAFEDEIKLPLSLLGSIAFTPKNLLLTADARWTDWTQLDFEGAVRDEDRQNAYRSTVDLSVGAEYQFSGSPARIRAGFSSQPLPYKLVPTDINFTFVPDDGNPDTSNDASYFTRSYDPARYDTGRYFWSVGAGTLIQEAMSVDVAYVHGNYKRSADDGRWTEEWSSHRVYASATFHF